MTDGAGQSDLKDYSPVLDEGHILDRMFSHYNIFTGPDITSRAT